MYKLSVDIFKWQKKVSDNLELELWGGCGVGN